MRRTANYNLNTLSEGVTAAVSRDQGVALSNAGILDLGDETLVFDTSVSTTAARDLWTSATQLTGRAPTMAANSHWHMDHLLGNQIFSDLPIWGTRRTIQILEERRRELERELMPQRLARDIESFEKLARKATSSDAREYLEMILRINRAVLADASDLRLTAPNRAFERKKRLGGPHRAELLSFGAGHTDADAILFLPSERVVFAGDLVVVDQHPSLPSGDPEHWVRVLDSIDRLKPERIVPGHGPVAAGSATAAVRDYLRTLLDMAERGKKPELPRRFARWGEHGQYEENLAFVRARVRRRRQSARHRRA